MKKLCILLILICPYFTINAQDTHNFERQKVGIVPVKEGKNYTAMLEAALGMDKRFDFIDEKQIPAILREMEKRQAGLTEIDDSSDLLLKNVHFIVTIDNISVNSFQARRERTVTEGQGKNKRTRVVVYYEWETTMKGVVKATRVQEGGTVDTELISASATGSDRQSSLNSAASSFESGIKNAVKVLFPIEAGLYGLTFSSVKLSRGTGSGVETGQRYIIRENKKVEIPGKTITETSEAAFVQIRNAQEEHSEADIIFSSGFDTSTAKAVEKLYSGISIELFGSIREYKMSEKNKPQRALWNMFDYNGGFGFWFGEFFQFGAGLDLGSPDDYFNLTMGIAGRYNFHLLRRLYLFPQLDLSFEYSSTDGNIRINTANHPEYKKTELEPDGIIETGYETTLSAYTFSASGGGGLKYILSYHVYLYTSCLYTLSWKFSEWKTPTPDETETRQQKALEDSIDKYDAYINDSLSPAGLKIRLGIGFYF